MADLTLKDNNLYQNGRITKYANGELELERDIILFPGDENDSYYTVVEGDEITVIAYNKYKDFTDDAGKYWWLIADCNNIENPLDLSEYIGQDITIPSFAAFKLRQSQENE